MRTIMLAVALLLPSTALARRAAPAPVPISAPDALAAIPANSTVVDGVETQRAWTMTEAQYMHTALRCQLDVQFGPTAEQSIDGTTVSVWSPSNPTHASEMRSRRLSRIVITRANGTVRVVVTAERAASTLIMASAN